MLAGYERALVQGEMDIAYGRIMFLGTAGIGKSSLKRSLMKLPWDPHLNSTILSDVSLVWHAMDNDKWREVLPEDEIDELAQLLAIVYKGDLVLNAVPALELFTKTAMKNVVPVSSTKIEETAMESMNTIFTEAMERARKIHVPKDLNSVPSKPFLHVWDCGGQPVFLEILPAFLTPRTMFLLLFDASKSIHEKWQSVQSIDGSYIVDEEVNETTAELMSNWSSTIHGHLMKYNQEGDPFDCPRLYYIGTHGDKVNGKRKSEITKELEMQYDSKAYAEIVNDVLIVDNTTSGTANEDVNISKLRSSISDFVHKKLVLRTPVTWILFRKVIMSYKEKVIDLAEAIAIGKACKIPQDDVPAALLFYHEVGAVLYYPHIDGLHDKVIINPKWFVDTLGKLFTLRQSGEGPASMRKLLNEKGIMLQPLCTHIWKEEPLDSIAITNLLVTFRLAAPIDVTEPVVYHDTGVKKYFLPAVLKSYSGELTVPPGRQQYASPLHITFTTGFVPPGFFTRLITTLCCESSFKLAFEKGFDIYRNRVTFLFGQPPLDHLILTDIHTAIQVDVLRYAPESSSIPLFNSVCQKLKGLLDESCKAVENILVMFQHELMIDETFKPIKIERAFKYVCKCSDGLHYLITVGGQTQDMILRCENKNTFFRMPTVHESFWFEGDLTVVPGAARDQHTETSPPTTFSVDSTTGQPYRPQSTVTTSECSRSDMVLSKSPQKQRDPSTVESTSAGATARDQINFPPTITPIGSTTSQNYPINLASESAFDFILLATPEINDVTECLVPIQDKWFTIGVKLGVDFGKLESLDQQGNDTMIKLCRMINFWKNRSVNTTWKEIIEALESDTVQCSHIAQKIREFLTKPNTLK